MAQQGPLPQVGQQQIVTVNGLPLQLVPGTYSCEEAPRFGEKISTGTLRYADFNPYESAHSVSSLVGGYGLRDYTDLPEGQESEAQGISMYSESENIDCRDGKIILGPYQRIITLPGSTETPVWIGEFSVAPGRGTYGGQTVLLAIAGTKIYKINDDFSATDLNVTLPANARKNAVGVFGSYLIIGFGSAAHAICTQDLSGFNPVTLAIGAGITTRDPLYCWAFTSDQAAAYIAGGPSPEDSNALTSSAEGNSDYDRTLLRCSDQNSEIVSLAPGGGVYIAIIGKEDELGAVDQQGIYRRLIPYASRASNNSAFLRWALGAPGRENQGPMSIFFSRDRNIWQFQPTSASSGQARDVSPWARPGLRPLNIRGAPTAFQGTARFAYWIMTSHEGSTWLLAFDQRSAAHHPIAALGTRECLAMCVSNSVPNEEGIYGPHLFMGYDNDLMSIDLPIDGEYPPDDRNCMYVATGTLDLPAITLGFPDEYKINFYVRVIAENLVPGQRTVQVSYAYDDSTTYLDLGTISESPGGEVTFPTLESSRRVKIRLRLLTDNPRHTPAILGLSVRMSLNSKLYRIWTFQAYVPSSTQPWGGADLQNPWSVINALWKARETGLPVDFVDRWNVPWTVRPLRIKETEVIREPGKTPETVLDLAFLSFAAGGGSLIWDDAASIWDDSDQRWGEYP